MIRRALVTVLNLIVLTVGLGQVPAHAAVPSESQWLADVDAAMAGSSTYLDHQVAAEGGRRLAINLDIDNTSLATYYANGQPVARVLRFARHARSQGMSLLFNTGRRSGGGRMVRAAHQLEAAGYVVTEVCGRRSGESLTHSKQRCRAHFAHEGYTLVANVGNRSTDFVGSGYQRAYRLPNYGNQLG